MANRRASSVVFGFDFQVNAAIILMLENISDLKSLRLEGNYEDIDLTLSNNQHILAQAKAVVNSSSDFHNVRRNLQKALVSLRIIIGFEWKHLNSEFIQIQWCGNILKKTGYDCLRRRR